MTGKKRGPGPYGTRTSTEGQCRVLPLPLRSELLNRLAVQGDIEAFAFDIAADPQADHHVDDLEQDQGDHGVINDDDGDALELIDQRGGVALDQAGGAAVLLDREHAREQRADDAAHGVDAEAVERVVNAMGALEACNPP